MATTRKKIAEQVLRIVNGGNISDDSHVDIREVMALVDQERDAIIKREIMTNAYSKGTAMSIAEAEIRGDWLTQEKLYMPENSNYVVLNNMPINLPNDMGIYRVESVFNKYGINPSGVRQTINKDKVTITITTGVAHDTSGGTALGFVGVATTAYPSVLDNAYLISFSWNDSVKTYKLSFNVSTEGYINSSDNGLNLINAIYNSAGWQNFLNTYNIMSWIDDAGDLRVDTKNHTTDQWSFSDFKINGQVSADSGHGFTYTVTETPGSFIKDSSTEDSSLVVHLGNKTYSVDYAWGDYNSVSTEEIAQNFVTKNANKMAMEHDVSVTSSGNVITIEEVIPMGGFNPDQFQSVGKYIRIATPGDIVASISQVSSWHTPISRFNERTIYTRMPSNGPHNPLYHKTALMSGRKFFYLEGNKIYLYKNYEDIDYLDVHYIATSSSIPNEDTYPVPADYEKEIITNLIQLFSLMKQAKEDLVNDNIG